MPVTPIAGFVPDADPTTPGIMVACDGYIPTTKGMRSAYEPVSVGYGVLNAACKGAVLAKLVDGSVRIFAGTAANLYEVATGAWAERSKSANAYSTSIGRWRFGQVGNVTLATNWYDPIQVSNLSGVFADLAASPKAKYLVTTKSTAGEFVMLGATDDSAVTISGGPNSEDQNRVWWSGLGNYTTWAPSLATEAGTLQLLDTPGPITGLKSLGDYVVAFKAKSMYLGTYQGNQIQWGFRCVSDDIGTVANESIVSNGLALFFVGQDSFYRFAGDLPVDIGVGIKEWFFADLDSENTSLICSLYDRFRDLIYWFYPSTATGGGVLDKWVCYHIATGRWGAGTNTIEAAMESIAASKTWDDLWTGLTFDTIPDTIYDSAYFAVGKNFPAVFDATHDMCSLSGGGGTNSFTTGYVGDDIGLGRLRRVVPRWQQLPASATCVHTYGNILGDTFTDKAAVSMSQGRFDLMQSARWHKLTISTTGSCEFSALAYDIVGAGRE